MLDERPSPIAGKWYSGDPEVLESEITAFLDNAETSDLGNIVGIIAPHAGYMYSGHVAGWAFAHIRGMKPDLVVVLSPMHHPHYDSVLTSSHAYYRTPLGNIPVDTEFVDEFERSLFNYSGIKLARISNDPEHSLEIELPFLQVALDSPFSLIPLMIREQTKFVSRNIGEVLGSMLAGKNTLLVGSTDLSHFYPQKTAIKLDNRMLEMIEMMDPDGVMDLEEKGMAYACGRGAVSAVLRAAMKLGARRATVVKRATSGDVTSDFRSVVGYGSVVISS